MSGPPISTYAAASSAATAAATAKVQRIDLWRQEVAVALSTPRTNQDHGKRFSRKRYVRRIGGSSSSNAFPSSSMSSSSSPQEQQARASKFTSFLSRLLRTKDTIGRAGTADGGGFGISVGNGDGSGSGSGNNDNEAPASRGRLRSYPFESTAMYRSIPVPMPPSPTRPLASVMNGAGEDDHGNMGGYEGRDEGSMRTADLNTSSSSSNSQAAGLLAKQERLERAARLLGKSRGREGKG